MQTPKKSTLQSQDAARQDVVLSDLWLVLRKRRILILGITVLMSVLAIVYGAMRGKQYMATGEIQIQPGSSSDLKQSLSAVLGGPNSLDDIMESDARILSSETLLMKVIRDLNLQDHADFLERKVKASNPVRGGVSVPLLHGDLNDPFVRAQLIKIMRRNLTVTRVPRTQMITISFESASPDLSASVVNTLQSEFIKNNFVAHFSNKQQVSNWLAEQIDDLRKVVQVSQDRMVDLQKKLGISALDPSHSVIVQEIGNLEKAATESTQQRVLAEARYCILQSLPPDQILDTPTQIGSEGAQNLLTNLRTQRASDQAELSRQTTLYGPNYPQVKQLAAHLAALNTEITAQQTRIVRQAKDGLAAAQSSEQQAKNVLDARVHELYGQRDDLVQYELLSQEYESNRSMYEKILMQLREAAVDAGLESADISIVDLAAPPIRASSMAIRYLILVGGTVGFLLGLITALIVDRIDTRVNDSRQIQDLLGVPGLAIIPQTNWKSKESERESANGPEILWDPRSAFSESFRVLRTSVQLSSSVRQSRVIAVSSCQPGEGKSTVAMNLAAALAQAGKRVLLVDTDMRRPSVFWRMGLSVKTGLSEYLTGNATLQDVVQKHAEIVGLDLLPSGFTPPLPADLLASDTMKQLIETLHAQYEYLILDTPPVLSVTDPLIVSAQADGVVLVTRQGYCTRDMLTRAREIFEEVDLKVYGFVLNGVNANLPEYYGYMGYYTYENGK